MKIIINTEFITIGQLLKKINIITTGGEAKMYLANNVIKINGEQPKGRNSKVYVGTTLWINDDLYQIVSE